MPHAAAAGGSRRWSRPSVRHAAARPPRRSAPRASVPAESALHRQIKRGLRPLWTCTYPFRGERIDTSVLRHPRPKHTKMKILPLFVLLACVAWQACAQDDESGKPVAARGLLKRGPSPRGKATTTTTPAPQEDGEYDEEAEYADEAAEPSSEAPPSSTEGKKLVGGGVRPFRSNTDLLETLKKRRQQVAEAKSRPHLQSESSAAPEAPVEPKSNYNTATRSIKADAAEEQPEAPSPAAPARSGRPFARRGSN